MHVFAASGPAMTLLGDGSPLTSAGVHVSVFACPSCPKKLLPQQYVRPEAVRAQVCCPPAARAR